jgi:DNA-binding transcriptional LysR family regulator
MVDLNNMLYFAEVVDQGGFAAAARQLGVPKSSLSRRITEMEAQLGVRLLHRTTRKLSLTQPGEAYYRHCAALREQAQAAQDAVAQVQGDPRGTIRVTCPLTIAQITLGPLMPLFLDKHPHVRVEMEVTNRVVDLVQEGIDVALRVRTSLDDSGSLVVKNLGRTGSVLLASPGLLEREGRPETIDDVGRLPSVTMSAVDGRAGLRLVGPGGATHDLQLRPRYTASDLMTVRFAVTAGIGIGFLPDYMCRRELREGTLVEVLPGWAPPAGILHAVFPSRRGLTPAVRRFLDFLGEQVTGEGEGCPE